MTVNSGLLALYALGALDEEDAAEVEAKLTEDPTVRAEFRLLAATIAELPYAPRPIEPPAALKAALLAQLETAKPAETAATSVRVPLSDRLRTPPRVVEPRSQVKDRSTPAPRLLAWERWLIAGFTAAVVIVLAVLRADREQLRNQVTRLTSENEALQVDLRTERSLLAGLANADVETVTLTGTGAQPGAAARLFSDRRAGRAVLVVRDLPKLADDQIYQLWLITGETPESAGTFAVDDLGQATVSLPSTAPLATFDAVGVSVEPAGGSDAPTGDIVLLGSRS